MNNIQLNLPLLFSAWALAAGFFYVFAEGLRRLQRKETGKTGDFRRVFRLFSLPLGLSLWGVAAIFAVLGEADSVGFELWPSIFISVALAISAAFIQQILIVESRRYQPQIVVASVLSGSALVGVIFFIIQAMQWEPSPHWHLTDWVLAELTSILAFYWFSSFLASRIRTAQLSETERKARTQLTGLSRLVQKILFATGQGSILVLAAYAAWRGVSLDPAAISKAPYYANLSVGVIAISLGVLGLLLTMLVAGLVIDAADSQTRRLTNELIEQTHILTRARERDLLTTLPNRLAAERHIADMVEQMQIRRELFSVFYIGIDNFRSINESLGFETGDHVLMLTAERIQQSVGEQDYIARMGGDEFAIVAPSCNSPACAVSLGARLVEILARHYELPGGQVPLSASIGISVFPNDGRSPADLLSHANLAMSEAKKAGRNQYCFFSEKMAEIVKRDFAIQSELRTALTNHEFVLYLQPQFNLKDRSLSGCEALVRWKMSDGSIRFPDKFIDVAERSGLIIPLGNQVLEQACSTVRRWLDEYGGAVRMGVNVSALQFQQPDFIDTIEAALAKSAIPPQFLQIELTESTVMHDAEISLNRFEALREMGVQVAIDDFGTGYSSLAYLKKFVCQHLKIDRSFVRDITHDAGDRHIVKAVIDLAHNFGLETVAEGVETIEQQDLLIELGCNETQGYYYSKPIPEAEFVQRFLLNGLTATKIRPTAVA